MKKKIASLAILAAILSFSPKQEKKVKIELTVAELNVVLASLQEQPMKQVGGLVLNIIEQAEPQLKDSTIKKK